MSPSNFSLNNVDALVKYLLDARNKGYLYPLNNPSYDEQFFGSINRFSIIAFKFQAFKKIIDVGGGDGILAAILAFLGHDVTVIDFFDRSEQDIYKMHGITFIKNNIEAESLPFDDNTFDALSCCQVFEHFTHSHLNPLKEMKRILKKGGLLEIDVPNAVCFRNRLRVLRGKHITWDYKKHYLDPKASLYLGREYYPDRHNREFVKQDLSDLLHFAEFQSISIDFLKDERLRLGLRGRLQSFGSSVRNIIPSTRKSLIAFANK